MCPIVIQSPKKFFQVVPIFAKECFKHDIFDRIYVATDSNDVITDKRCVVIKLNKDNQFASNIIYVLNKIKDDIVLLCCEDHVMIEDHDKSEFEQCFNFIKDNSDVGYLRLTHNQKVKFVKNTGLISELHPKYQYLISLQPSFWRKEFLIKVLKDGEDAWATETRGTKRAAKLPYRKFCVTDTVFKATNFFKSGQYLRHYFVEYAKANEIEVPNQMKVFDKRDGNKKIVDQQDYK